MAPRADSVRVAVEFAIQEALRALKQLEASADQSFDQIGRDAEAVDVDSFVDDLQRAGNLSEKAFKEASRVVKGFDVSVDGAEDSVEDLVRDLQRLEKKLKDNRKAGAGLSGVFGRIRSAAGGLTGALTALGAGFGLREVTDRIAAFERQIDTTGVVARATEQDQERLKQSALDLGSTYEFTATQVGELQEAFARSGQSVNQILASTASALDLATAENLELAESATIIATTLKQFNKEASESGKVADNLAAVSQRANTNVRQLAEGLNKAAPAAAQAGQPLEDVVAILGRLADKGLRGAEAGTGLNSVILKLQQDTPQLRSVLAELGLTLDDVDIKQRGLLEVLSSLEQANLTGAQAQRIFGLEAVKVALNVVDSVESTRELRDEIQGLTGVTATAAKEISDNLDGALKKLGSTIDGIILKTGDKGLGAALRSLVDLVRKGVEGLEDDAERIATLSETIGTAFGEGGLAEVVRVLGELSETGEVARERVEAFAASSQQAVSTIDAFRSGTASAGAALGALSAAFSDYQNSSDQSAEKTEALLKLYQILAAEFEASGREVPLALDRIGAALTRMALAGRDAASGTQEATQATSELSKAARELLGEVTASADAQREQAAAIVEVFEALKRGGSDSQLELTQVIERAESLVEVMREAGVEVPKELEAIANSAIAPKERIAELSDAARDFETTPGLPARSSSALELRKVAVST